MCPCSMTAPVFMLLSAAQAGLHTNASCTYGHVPREVFQLSLVGTLLDHAQHVNGPQLLNLQP